MSKDDLPEFLKKQASGTTPVRVELEQNEQLRVWNIPVDLCVPTVDNPNEMDDETFNTLVEEMDESNPDSPGFVEPIHVVPLEDGRFQIIGGEHRWRGFKTLGKQTIPGIVMTDEKWNSKEFQEFMLVRLNVLRGKMNAEKFLVLYNRYVERHGNEKLQRMFAFTDADYWQKLTGGTRQVLNEIGAPPELLKDFDNKTKEIGSVDSLAAILNGLFSKYGDTLRWNFMVFTYGSKDHLMIQMSQAMAKHMESVKRWCRDNQADINLVMEPVVAKFGEVVSDPKVAGALLNSSKGKQFA